MRLHFERAISNVTKHGDTDIFPFPVENHVFFDKKSEVVSLLVDIDNNFDEMLARFPPSNRNALAPVGYQGFRWATQLDPLWNLFFLGVVLSISEEIEAARIPKTDNVVFSYRYLWDDATSDLFDRKCNWRSFMEHSNVLASNSKYVVSCDISEFYPRLNHHRLENALMQLRLKGNQPSKIMEFLTNFSGTKSFGLPVGGPAARILSEIALDQIDRLLRAQGIRFCRFADDYHLFCDTTEAAFRALLFLSERLLQNQGLQLQKAKTRISSSKEFLATNPLALETDPEGDEPASDSPPTIKEQSQNLMRLSLRFDPYSATAQDEYEALKSELQKYDIIGLLRSELAKSRIHISLSKRIVSAIRYIGEAKDEAVLALIQNEELLYPIYGNVLLVAKSVYEELKPETQKEAISYVRQLVANNSHVVQVELNLAYAVRFLGCEDSPENHEILNRVYKETPSIPIRRDIILAMAKWRAWYWLSDLTSNFRTLAPAERRAFLIASYFLTDEGRHWRRHIDPELSRFESLVKTWASEKVQLPGWRPPL